jgi:thymidylate synthase ThyX
MCILVQFLYADLHSGAILYDIGFMSGPMTAAGVKPKRVLTVAPMPPEKLAYALARYSRSPNSIRESLDWVRTHDSAKFLESFYFQYGHASIADLGHVTVCFEGVSELAATEIEDEQLWDGQARSSRYQNFSKSGFVTPPELTADEAATYCETVGNLLNAYQETHKAALEYLEGEIEKPEQMKEDAYRRNLAARAFDVARYLLPFGISTGVGQVTSIRTLERQIARLKASEFQELRDIAEELARSCSDVPECPWDQSTAEPLAPTLARHAEADEYAIHLRADLKEWCRYHLPPAENAPVQDIDLIQPDDHLADICASLLYPVTDRPFRELYTLACSWNASKRAELLMVALGQRTAHDELPRHFRSAPFVFDLVMDIGAYRDLHRHRRCQQLRQPYTNKLGYDTPDVIQLARAEETYSDAIRSVDAAIARLPQPASQYLLPLAARSRFLFKMDFAELEYISRLRSGVKGHFAYRKVAWEMKQALEKVDPVLGGLINATPPWVVDPLRR